MAFLANRRYFASKKIILIRICFQSSKRQMLGKAAGLAALLGCLGALVVIGRMSSHEPTVLASSHSRAYQRGMDLMMGRSGGGRQSALFEEKDFYNGKIVRGPDSFRMTYILFYLSLLAWSLQSTCNESASHLLPWRLYMHARSMSDRWIQALQIPGA